MRLILPLVLLLAACVPPPGPVASRNTGLVGSYSRQVAISNDVHHVLYGHVVEATREGEVVRALVVSQRRDGVHRLRFQEVWSDGVQLPFSRSSALDGCSHGHCLNRHAGMILLSDPLFAHAQTHGLRARMIGGQANIDIAVPADLFLFPPP